MSLVEQVFEPLVKDDIAAPSRIEFATIFPDQLAKLRVPVIARQAHGLSQAAVEISSNLDIRVGKPTVACLEMVSQRQGYRVAAPLENFDIKLAVPGNTRAETAVEPFQLRDQLQKSKIVTLIQRHQTDEAARLYDGLWNEL